MFVNLSILYTNILPLYIFVAPPTIDTHIKDQKLEVGEPFKIKIPIGGDGPFEVKVKKNNKEVPEDGRVKVSVFDDFATIAIRGEWLILLIHCISVINIGTYILIAFRLQVGSFA